jgi:FAD/FMN-containing dehydrogenase
MFGAFVWRFEVVGDHWLIQVAEASQGDEGRLCPPGSDRLPLWVRFLFLSSSSRCCCHLHFIRRFRVYSHAYPISRHVGDGNVHSLALFSSDAELETIREAVHEMVERAIRLEGTCTGEHGVGVGKVEYLNSELGEGTVGLMETVKRTCKL